jgi:hypothetical protein
MTTPSVRLEDQQPAAREALVDELVGIRADEPVPVDRRRRAGQVERPHELGRRPLRVDGRPAQAKHAQVAVAVLAAPAGTSSPTTRHQHEPPLAADLGVTDEPQRVARQPQLGVAGAADRQPDPQPLRDARRHQDGLAREPAELEAGRVSVTHLA